MGQLFVFHFIEDSCQSKTIGEHSHTTPHQGWVPKEWHWRAKQFSYSAIRGDTSQDSRNEQFKYPKATRITWRTGRQTRISAGCINFLGRDCCSQQPQLLHQWDQHPTTTPFFHPSPLFDLDSSEEDRQWKCTIQTGAARTPTTKDLHQVFILLKTSETVKGCRAPSAAPQMALMQINTIPGAKPGPHVTFQPSHPRQQNPLDDPDTLCTEMLCSNCAQKPLLLDFEDQ